jgi:vesicle transport through interaction with t-SNAREs protein 1
VICIDRDSKLNEQGMAYLLLTQLGQADSWIAKSQGVLRTMQKRLVENKLLSWGIIALLILLIIAIIVAKFS